MMNGGTATRMTVHRGADSVLWALAMWQKFNSMPSAGVRRVLHQPVTTALDDVTPVTRMSRSGVTRLTVGFAQVAYWFKR